MTRVLAFGTFDRMHPGHVWFLQQAAALGDVLLVGVARDAHGLQLKNKRPHQKETERLASVCARPEVFEAHLCDEHLGSFELINRFQPDLIALGHDQDDLAQELHTWMARHGLCLPCVRIKKYETDQGT